ncbi:MAG TPA: hypothetical protein VLY24_07570 [Bryobacteraceae bacterium]|nr:hypothetical protein [Bryobacteraceae bacterium]
MTLAHVDMLIAYTAVMLGVSLIITVLTQMVSASLGLRGTNLLWGTKTLLKSIDPQLESQAEAMLTHPIISDSLVSTCGQLRDKPLVGRLVRRWTLASAIRAGELVRMLAAHAQQLRSAGGETNLETAVRIESALQSSDADTLRHVQILTAAFQTLAPHYAVQVDKILDQMAASQQALCSVEARFHSAMDRVSQRFAVQMRVWTVIFSFLLAIGVQLDSFRLLARLWNDPQARESLANTSASLMKEAAAILPSASASDRTAIPGAAPELYEEVFERLKAKYPNETKGIGPMPIEASYADARIWLERNLTGNDPRVLEDYTRSVSGALAQQANSIRHELESSGFLLIPRPYHPLHFDDAANFLGTLVSALLLSLGAPFWFNALKSLSSLRPVLANKQDGGA